MYIGNNNNNNNNNNIYILVMCVRKQKTHVPRCSKLSVLQISIIFYVDFYSTPHKIGKKRIAADIVRSNQ